jgi:hypothetical protein
MSKSTRGIAAFYKGREDEVRDALSTMTIAEAAKHFDKSTATISDAKRKLGMVGQGKSKSSEGGVSKGHVVSRGAKSQTTQDLEAENRVLKQLLADANLEIARMKLGR